MAVVASTDCCCLLDHRRYLNEIYSNCIDQRLEYENRVVSPNNCGTTCVECHAEMFAISTPFRMASQKAVGAENPRSERKRLKRCRQHSTHFSLRHERIKSHMKSCMTDLVSHGIKAGFLRKMLTPHEVASNNSEAQGLACKIGGSRKEWGLDISNKETSLNIYKFNDLNFYPPCLDNTLVEYSGTSACIVKYDSTCYVLPPHCSFYISDIQFLPKLAETGKLYEVIVVDPPWPNKSVKRKKGYYMLTLDDIARMPICRLGKKNCLIFIWATNNESILNFVREELFPSWKVKFLTEWHWAKITLTGEPTGNIDSPHKKPYEHLVIGRIGDLDHDYNWVLNYKVIFSVPSCFHSHKPPLSEILNNHMPRSFEGLELFARSLTPNWTSWGNEVLKLQELDFFKVTSSQSCISLSQIDSVAINNEDT